MNIRKKLILSKNDYYVKHLSIISNFLPETLTPKEIEVLAAFMSLEGDIAEDRFCTSARKIVREQLGISPGGLGNYLKAFREKKYIKQEDNGFVIMPILLPNSKTQGYEFILSKVS